MDEVDVSVVINVLNGAKTISNAVDSALSQTHNSIEVVVWDNGSSDETQRIVKDFGDQRIRFYRTEETVPLYEARNKAVGVCRGKFIAFLDADDWWRPDKLSLQLRKFVQGVDGVYSNYFRVNELTGKIRPYTRKTLPSGDIFSRSLHRYRVGLLTLVVRREVFERQIFDPTLEIIGDFDFVMKLSTIARIDCIQDYLAWSRFDGNNESERKKQRHLNELADWCDKGLETGLLKGTDLRKMRRMVRAKRAEVEFESGNYMRGTLEFLRVRPIGRQAKVAQRIFMSRLSARRMAEPLNSP